MPVFDLVIRGGQVVTPDGIVQGDIAVADGTIVELGGAIAGTGATEVDAGGLHVFPGGIDPHVHFQEPGHADWEGFAAGSGALAAGGMTVFFDMPLDAVPPTTDGAGFDQKLAAARASSVVDFALWGGLVPGNVDHLEELAERGVVGFKAFMANGTDDFPAVDDLTLYEGMRRCAALGCLVAVHAENEQLTRGLTERAIAAGRTGPRDFLASRPIVAENEAMARALLFAGETGCALHIVHVTTARGVALVAEARAQGVDASCETCPQYLVLCEDDVEALGALAKCAPPIRPAAERDRLWACLRDGSLGIVASDHSPCLTEGDPASGFFAAPGGISGCQTTRQLLLEHGYDGRGMPLPAIAALTATNAARRFNLPAKGVIAVGYDADLALIDVGDRHILRAEELLYRHKRSPFVGRTLRGRVERTYLRGVLVHEQGRIVSPPMGRLLTPRGRHGQEE